MAQKQRVILLLPDGVGVRNFMLSDFTALCQEKYDLHVLHDIPDNILEKYRQFIPSPITWHKLLPQIQHSVAQESFMRLLVTAHQYKVNTKAMKLQLMVPTRGRWQKKIFRYAMQQLSRLFANKQGIKFLERKIASSQDPEVLHYYTSLFEKIEPRFVFCTHQRPFNTLAPTLAAKALNIPTATFIFSWDNITSKGRIAAPFDHFLVWSDLMKKEFEAVYDDVTSDRIHVVGTPQFESYSKKSWVCTKTDFFKEIGADPNRPLICYSGGTEVAIPDDHLHIDLVMQMIREGTIQGNPQILLRPNPSDKGVRYKHVCEKYPEIIFRVPEWDWGEGDDWQKLMPSIKDMKFLTNLTRHCDLNINMASTMTLDFGMNGTPVVNIAFDMSHPPKKPRPIHQFYYEFDHYKHVVESKAVKIAYNAQQLAEHVNAYLNDPNQDKAFMKQLIDLEISVPLEASSQLTLDVLDTLKR